MAGNEKRMNPADSAGTDGALEGQSPAETALVLATPTTVLPAARCTRASTELAARSQAPLPPDTTSQALLTQDELAILDEPCELQQQEGSCWSQVTVACFFICSLTV